MGTIVQLDAAILRWELCSSWLQGHQEHMLWSSCLQRYWGQELGPVGYRGIRSRNFGPVSYRGTGDRNFFPVGHVATGDWNLVSVVLGAGTVVHLIAVGTECSVM